MISYCGGVAMQHCSTSERRRLLLFLCVEPKPLPVHASWIYLCASCCSLTRVDFDANLLLLCSSWVGVAQIKPLLFSNTVKVHTRVAVLKRQVGLPTGSFLSFFPSSFSSTPQHHAARRLCRCGQFHKAKRCSITPKIAQAPDYPERQQKTRHTRGTN